MPLYKKQDERKIKAACLSVSRALCQLCGNACVLCVHANAETLMAFGEIRVGRPDGFNVTSSLWKLCNVEIWSKNKHIGVARRRPLPTLRGIDRYELDEKHIAT